MEALTLPQDAAKLWAPTARAVADTLERYRCTPRIGGGTILTARFNGHRRSFDIDLKVSTHEAHGLMRAAKSPEIQRLIERHGGRSTIETTEHGAIWQIEFPELGLGSQMPRIQTWSNTPEPEKAEDWGTVDGDRIRIQSNSQILYGKLKRAGRLAPRDMIDIKTAERMDPTGLSIAVNTFGEARLQKAMGGWRDERTLIANRAHVQVRGTSETERKTWDTLADDAAAACEGAVYNKVILKPGPEVLKFSYRTRSGRTGTHEVRRSHAEDDFKRTGLNEWLDEHGHEPHEISRWTPRKDGTEPQTLYLGPLKRPGTMSVGGSAATSEWPERPSSEDDTVQQTRNATRVPGRSSLKR